jgi:hypothetical protein
MCLAFCRGGGGQVGAKMGESLAPSFASGFSMRPQLRLLPTTCLSISIQCVSFSHIFIAIREHFSPNFMRG